MAASAGQSPSENARRNGGRRENAPLTNIPIFLFRVIEESKVKRQSEHDPLALAARDRRKPSARLEA